MSDADRFHTEAVNTVFYPKSVAIVGASQQGAGLHAVENLASGGYSGIVGCVNPRYEQVAGVPCVPSIDELDFAPEVVVMAVARERLIPLLEAAAAKGARAAVIFAIGFAEADELGGQLQRQLRDIARGAEMAIIGPNCQGLINFVQSVPLYMGTVHPYEPGRVALLSESGSVITSLLSNRRGVRWSHAVSSGNEAVTDSADILRYYVDSSDVDTICCYLETVRRPDEFFEQCDRAAELGKPIVVCKSGRTLESQQAATAHTGALATPYRLIESSLRRHGVVTTGSLEELLETTLLVQSKKKPKGSRVAVLTGSGGQIELLFDNVKGSGVSFPQFSESTKEKLRETLASFLHPNNPLDWWGTPVPSLPTLLETVADDANIDIVVQVSDFAAYGPGPTGYREENEERDQALARLNESRDQLFVFMDGVEGAPTAEDYERGIKTGIPVVSGMELGLKVLGNFARYATTTRAQRHPSLAKDAVRAAWAELSPGTNGGPSALRLLEAAGFDVPRWQVASSPEQARQIAKTIGYPLVAKTADESIAHKTESNAVFLNICDDSELEEAIEKLSKIGSGLALVEEQVDPGVEIILGLSSDAKLGTFITVGLGGIWTEIIDDVQVRPIGLAVGEAEEMLRSLRGFALLQGARGRQPVDLASLALTIERLDDMAIELAGELVALDINPLMASDKRNVIADALVVRREDSR